MEGRPSEKRPPRGSSSSLQPVKLSPPCLQLLQRLLHTGRGDHLKGLTGFAEQQQQVLQQHPQPEAREGGGCSTSPRSPTATLSAEEEETSNTTTTPNTLSRRWLSLGEISARSLFPEKNSPTGIEGAPLPAPAVSTSLPLSLIHI